MNKLQGLSIAVLAFSISACTMNVTSTADRVDVNPGDGQCADSTGQCTLRAAIMEVNESLGSWRIAVPAGQYVLDYNIGGGLGLTIERSMRIQGAGAQSTVIDATGDSRGFLINGGDNIEIQSLTITNGDGQFGGGMFVDGGRVFLSDVDFVENDAFTGAGALFVGQNTLVEGDNIKFSGNSAVGAFGGAVQNQGRLVLRQSLFHDNESNRAGALHNSADAELNLFNVTMSGNHGRSDSRSVGGMLNLGFAVLRNTTVAYNEGGGETGAGGLQMTSDATTVAKNSLFAENFRRTRSRPVGSDCKGRFSSDSRYNLVEARDDCTIPGSTSTWVLDVDAGLVALAAASGSPTRTHPLRSDSPAIDAGFPFPPGSPAADACRATDQRGVPRPQTLYSETSEGRCDIGAHESGYHPNFISGFTLVNANTNEDIGPLRNGDVLILSNLPDELSVRANVTFPVSDSVRFGYDDNPSVRTENLSPYSIAGDSGGNYAPFAFGANGEHTIVATPFSGDDASGSGGGSKSITITVLQ